jgi:hypothetical protein
LALTTAASPIAPSTVYEFSVVDAVDQALDGKIPADGTNYLYGFDLSATGPIAVSISVALPFGDAGKEVKLGFWKDDNGDGSWDNSMDTEIKTVTGNPAEAFAGELSSGRYFLMVGGPAGVDYSGRFMARVPVEGGGGSGGVIPLPAAGLMFSSAWLGFITTQSHGRNKARLLGAGINS